MSYQYQVAPKPGTGFTTRVSLGEEVPAEQIDAAVAAATGVSLEKCPEVLEAYLQQILQCAAQTRPCRFGTIFRAQPTSGGAKPSPDGFHTPDDLNADVRISFTSEAIRAWRASLALSSQGEVGWVTPTIDNIISEENGLPNRYTPGTLIRIRGTDLKLTKTQTSQGVFFKPSAGPEVRAAVYGPISPSEIVVMVPASLSGDLQVRVVSMIHGNLRSFVYTTPLHQ